MCYKIASILLTHTGLCVAPIDRGGNKVCARDRKAAMPRRNLANGKLRNGRNRAFSRTYLLIAFIYQQFHVNSGIYAALTGAQARFLRSPPPSSLRDRALTDRFRPLFLACR